MPRAFAWTHPRTRTPWVAIGSVIVLTLALVIVLARITWDDPFVYFGFMATTATFGILAAYILIALAGMVFFWRTRQSSDTAFSVLFDVLLPLGAIAICAYTIYESFRSPGPSRTPGLRGSRSPGSGWAARCWQASEPRIPSGCERSARSSEPARPPPRRRPANRRAPPADTGEADMSYGVVHEVS